MNKMQGYINRLFGWGKQPEGSKNTVAPPPKGKGVNAASIIMSNIPDSLVEYPPQPFDVPLYNKRLDLLKYLVENNQEDAVSPEINALLTALMEQLEVKVYEPPDDIEYELQGPYVKDGE
jgi:hypothetical protein